MNVENKTPLMQDKSADILFSFNDVIDKKGVVSKIDSPKSLRRFDVSLSTGDMVSVLGGNISKSISQ
jgi:hypothetical protein